MRLLILILLFPAALYSQNINTAQQKALNSYVEYANQSADEVSAIVKSLMDYYPSMHQKSSWGPPRYTCPVQLEQYYLNTALTLGKTLNATVSTPLNEKLNDLKQAAEKIDARCKDLDTYHKLEDYKQDNFQKAETIINEMQLLVADYRKKQEALNVALESAFKKLHKITETTYSKADDMIRAQITRERSFLDRCKYNLNDKVHTGWVSDELQKSILETDTQLKALQAFKPVLKYPASGMWSNFIESLSSVLEVKRNGLDGYNFEAKKSDEHSNEVYLGLINYFNGTLIADQNMFILYASNDGFYGLKAMKYVTQFEIRTQAKDIDVSVQPFKDISHTPVTIAPQKTVLAKPVYHQLTNYIDFINETWRQTRYMRMVLVSFNSSASYYKGLDSYERHGGLSFDYKNFQLPLSLYQQTITESKSLPQAIAKSLNEQAEVLINILKEMDGLAAWLEVETRERRYEKDRLKKVYENLERQKVLMDEWDKRKEVLYKDVRTVYDAYPEQPGSWYVSGKALRTLTDLDHDALFQARDHYTTNGPSIVSTEKIDATIREVIGKEYENMKGIDKYGRNNGLCPYTPYEDLPVTSKSLSEELKKLKDPSPTSEHPYHRLVYDYNEIVSDYNKFCELSKDALHLPTVNQPEFFFVKYPVAKTEVAKQTTMPSPEPTRQQPVKEVVREEPKREAATEVKSLPPAEVKERTTVKHDTIYIEKRDTVYLAEPGEDLRSMEGYATNNMVLLLDVSGSMNSPDKLPLLKTSVLELMSMMRQEDQVSIIAFSEKPKAVLTATSFKEANRVKKAIDDLKSSGKTDGNAGVKLAYKVADEHYVRGGNNRIILATDGEFVLNEETRQLIEKFSKEDIYLTIFNFGKGAGASRSLEALSVLGKGNYRHISKENVDLQLIREVKAKKKK